MANQELFDAVRSGNLLRVQELLPGEGNEWRRVNALGASISINRIDIARFLLESGVPTEPEFCEDFMYPLHTAVRADNPAAVALLLGAGAQTEVFRCSGITPLYDVRSAAVARLLLDAGADVNVGGPETGTPLHQMALDSNDGALRELVAHPGVELDIKGYKGQRPLHYAVSNFHIDSPCADDYLAPIGTLLAAGADPCAVDDVNRTPLALFGSIIWKKNGEGIHPDVYRAVTLLVAAGDRQWRCVPTPCPGLEAALVPVWKAVPKERVPEELAQLFRRLEPGVQAALREALRALHHGARLFGGLDDPLRIKILSMALE